jgi:hypothetical protein
MSDVPMAPVRSYISLSNRALGVLIVRREYGVTSIVSSKVVKSLVRPI